MAKRLTNNTVAHPADIQDRDGGGPVLAAARHAFPVIAKVFADSG